MPICVKKTAPVNLRELFQPESLAHFWLSAVKHVDRKIITCSFQETYNDLIYWDSAVPSRREQLSHLAYRKP